MVRKLISLKVHTKVYRFIINSHHNHLIDSQNFQSHTHILRTNVIEKYILLHLRNNEILLPLNDE